MKRKIILIALSCVAVAALLLLLRGDAQTRITRLVLRNAERLEEIAVLLPANPLAEVSFPGVKQMRVLSATKTVVFDVSARGFGSQTAYYGFYYSPDDAPLVLQADSQSAANNRLRPKASGWYQEEAEGDNWLYTEKIADRWYYFETHY